MQAWTWVGSAAVRRLLPPWEQGGIWWRKPRLTRQRPAREDDHVARSTIPVSPARQHLERSQSAVELKGSKGDASKTAPTALLRMFLTKAVAVFGIKNTAYRGRVFLCYENVLYLRLRDHSAPAGRSLSSSPSSGRSITIFSPGRISPVSTRGGCGTGFSVVSVRRLSGRIFWILRWSPDGALEKDNCRLSAFIRFTCHAYEWYASGRQRVVRRQESSRCRVRDRVVFVQRYFLYQYVAAHLC